MDKHFTDRLASYLFPVRAWHFLVLAVAFLAIGLLQMRSNYAHMVVLRDKVYAADKAGEGVNEALTDLRNYVNSHMNTNLSGGENAAYPPIQLKYTYERLVKAASKETKTYNAKLYTKAQEYCEATIPNGFHGDVRVKCIENYVAKYGQAGDAISADLYKFDFYSPTWAPDVAGISLLLSALSAITFVVTVVSRRLFPTRE